MSEGFSIDTASRARFLLNKIVNYHSLEGFLSLSDKSRQEISEMNDDLHSIILASKELEESPNPRIQEIQRNSRDAGLRYCAQIGILCDDDAIALMNKVEPKIEQWEQGLIKIESETRMAIAKLQENVFARAQNETT